MKLKNRAIVALVRSAGALTALVAIVEAGSKWN